MRYRVSISTGIPMKVVGADNDNVIDQFYVGKIKVYFRENVIIKLHSVLSLKSI